ncbi:bifunctional diguanylate cyclase/phosphodiesterase [Azospira sp. I09]|uniref:bifunctional diguanylate cyclase/phosphodiesterase n=1 Tax=Azospira sp. I09 TaxID=1765049 RepID=UPI001260EFC6|nr:EAL domain-containing protein [Azospira sp. I09]BBN88183.1 hypothetical protein AZSP09_12060 [Azospira sp. I09]
MSAKRPKLYLVFFILAVLGTVVPAAFLLGSAYYNEHRQAAQDARNIAGVLEARLEATLRRIESNLGELVADLPRQALHPSAFPRYGKLMQRQLALRASHFPEIVGLRVLDAQANVLYASDVAQPKVNLEDRSYFQALRQNPGTHLYFSEVMEGRISGRTQVVVAMPIRRDDGAFAGVAVAALDIRYFQQLFDAIDLGPQGVITFRRSDDGRLVLRRPERPGTVNQTLSNNPMHLRVEAGEREGVISYRAALDQMERVYAFKRIGDFPFYVAVGIAAKDFLAPWYLTLGITSGVELIFLAGLGLLLWRLDRAERRRAAASQALASSERRFQQLLDSAGEGICGLDRQGRLTFANPAARRLLGFGEELPRGDFLQQVYADDAGAALRTCLEEDRSVHSDDALFARADGSRFPVQYDLYPLAQEAGVAQGAVLLFADIAERKRHADQIEYLAHHDALTGLPNRLLAEDRFNQALAAASRRGEQVALLFLDLDGFKTINDSLGHEVGDKVLRAVADRLRSHLRESDTVSRFGGDEFLVIMPGLQQVEVIYPVIGKLLACLEQPLALEHYQLSTSVSIGVAVFPHDGRDFTTLMQKADTAMYHAKDAGRNTYRLFDEAMNLHAQETLRLRNNFQRGLDGDEFVLHLLPQVDLASGQVVGAEALVRWQDGSRLIAPAHFIPVAESSGFIVPLGQWVLRESCRLAARWQRELGREVTIAVNISAIQFKRGDLERTVAEALAESGLPPHLLELELTESTLLNQTESVLSTLRTLRDQGVRLSIDDFGTGYSSLAYLKRLAVNKLKIDQSFVRNLDGDAEDAAIVRAIIEMAHRLNLRTVAEGVETVEVLQSLRRFACDEAQGYYFARPLPVDEFERFLASWSGLLPGRMAY